MPAGELRVHDEVRAGEGQARAERDELVLILPGYHPRRGRVRVVERLERLSERRADVHGRAGEFPRAGLRHLEDVHAALVVGSHGRHRFPEDVDYRRRRRRRWLGVRLGGSRLHAGRVGRCRVPLRESRGRAEEHGG